MLRHCSMIILTGLILLSVAEYMPASASGTEPAILVLPTTVTAGKSILLLDVGHRYIIPPVKEGKPDEYNVNISVSFGIVSPLDFFYTHSFLYEDTFGGLKWRARAAYTCGCRRAVGLWRR